MTALRLTTIATLFLVLVSFKHEFYVSITQIYVKEDTLQVAIKIFTDDLEHVLEDEFHTKIFLDHTTNDEKAFRYIKDYSSRKFTLGNASKSYDITWIGHEYIEDVTWIYAYAVMDKSAKILFVKNILLMEDHNDQHNMIQFSQTGKSSSQLCTKEQPEVRFVLE